MKDVVGAIQGYMESDYENNSGQLIFMYNIASEEHKKVIDDVLITVCGYSMPTLLKHADELGAR